MDNNTKKARIDADKLFISKEEDCPEDKIFDFNIVEIIPNKTPIVMIFCGITMYLISSKDINTSINNRINERIISSKDYLYI